MTIQRLKLVDEKYSWILILCIAVFVYSLSFLTPSRLLEHPVDTIIKFLQASGVIDYISIYSIVLIPIIIGLIIFQKSILANLMISIYIICRLGYNFEISNILAVNLTIEGIIWFTTGLAVLLILFLDLDKNNIRRKAKIILSIIGLVFIFLNIYSLFDIRLENEIGVLTIFILTFLIFNGSKQIKSKIYILLYTVFFIFINYLLIENLSCNVEFVSDYGITNWGVGHMFHECGTYFIWLLTGFLMHIALLLKQKTNKFCA